MLHPFPNGRIPLRMADTAEVVACKICGGDAPPFGAVDFHKNCEDSPVIRFAPSGIAVWYRRCASCGFLFTTFCDGWTAAEFAERIYNEDYVLVDPDYVAKRPLQCVQVIRQIVEPVKATIRLCDYGGGDGLLARSLREAGFACDSWDPFGTAGARQLAAQQYDFVSCIEVIEHTADPVGTVEAIAALLRADGIVLFSTLLQQANLPQAGGLAWWYAAPRNGHISIHTDDSLTRLWQKVGMRVAVLNETTYIAFRDTLPDFAKVLYRVKGARGLP
ncbi:MAG: hypothetical protein JWL84_4676 [Rhodospirillales bacterium]|nr:hypothetical protein [Rhodospirillales bacterium]